jgi:hypothetical protein
MARDLQTELRFHEVVEWPLGTTANTSTGLTLRALTPIPGGRGWSFVTIAVSGTPMERASGHEVSAETIGLKSQERRGIVAAIDTIGLYHLDLLETAASNCGLRAAAKFSAARRFVRISAIGGLTFTADRRERRPGK